jgi:hypothetical protein
MPTFRAAPALLALAVAIPAAPAAAQGAPTPPAQSGDSISALRQEVERLTQELKRKQAELDAALARIKALESKAAGATGAPATPAPDSPAAPVPAPVPADPAIGPGGLLAAFQAEYLAAFREVPDGSDAQKLNLHLRALEAWCAKGNRDALKRHTWIGQIDASTFAVNGRNCSFAAVFRNGTREFRYPVTVDQGMLSRVRDRSGAPMAGDLAFDVVVRPRLTVNPGRAARGAFENPPMVAPYVEYLLDLEPRSILPPAAEPAK